MLFGKPPAQNPTLTPARQASMRRASRAGTATSGPQEIHCELCHFFCTESVHTRSGDGKAQAVKAREKSSSWECQAPGLTCTELQANLTLLSAERRLPPTTPLTLDACSRKASTEQECCMDCSLPQRGPATPPTRAEVITPTVLSTSADLAPSAALAPSSV